MYDHVKRYVIRIERSRAYKNEHVDAKELRELRRQGFDLMRKNDATFSIEKLVAQWERDNERTVL